MYNALSDSIGKEKSFQLRHDGIIKVKTLLVNAWISIYDLCYNYEICQDLDLFNLLLFVHKFDTVTNFISFVTSVINDGSLVIFRLLGCS